MSYVCTPMKKNKRYPSGGDQLSRKREDRRGGHGRLRFCLPPRILVCRCIGFPPASLAARPLQGKFTPSVNGLVIGVPFVYMESPLGFVF